MGYEEIADEIYRIHDNSGNRATTIPVDNVSNLYNKLYGTSRNLRKEAKFHIEEAVWNKYRLGVYFLDHVVWIVPDTNCFPG